MSKSTGISIVILQFIKLRPGEWLIFTAHPHCYASAVIAKAFCLYGCLSVRRLSVTFRCFVQTNKDTIAQSSASYRTIPLVSGEVKFIRIFAGDHPQRGRESEATPLSLAKIWLIISHNLETVRDSTYSLIESHMSLIRWTAYLSLRFKRGIKNEKWRNFRQKLNNNLR